MHPFISFRASGLNSIYTENKIYNKKLVPLRKWPFLYPTDPTPTTAGPLPNSMPNTELLNCSASLKTSPPYCGGMYRKFVTGSDMRDGHTKWNVPRATIENMAATFPVTFDVSSATKSIEKRSFSPNISVGRESRRKNHDI